MLGFGEFLHVCPMDLNTHLNTPQSGGKARLGDVMTRMMTRHLFFRFIGCTHAVHKCIGASASNLAHRRSIKLSACHVSRHAICSETADSPGQ